eukprot:403377401
MHNQNVESAVEYLLEQYSQNIFDQSSLYSGVDMFNQSSGGRNMNSNNTNQSLINMNEEKQMKLALEQSLAQSQGTDRSYGKASTQINSSNHSSSQNQINQNYIDEELIVQWEPLDAEERLRIDDTPVGLKNVGNTCYFNSIIQSYFFIPNFTEKILQSFMNEQRFQESVKQLNQQVQDEIARKRLRYSKQLVLYLSKLLGQMILSNKKYLDPTFVLKSLTDDFGNRILIGEQKDIGEFNMNFIERIEEGLGESVKIEDSNIFEEEQKQMHKMLSQTVDRKSSLVMDPYTFTEEEQKRQFNASQQIDKKQLQPKNTIHENFFGGKVTLIKVLKEQQAPQIVSEKQEKLGSIFLNIDHQNLYEAWNEAFLDQVSGFVKDQESQRCISESWMTQPPNVLFFSLNRVQYDKVAKQPIKNNSLFKFDKVIYADMFLFKNRERTEMMRNQIQQTKDKIKQLNENLKIYESFLPGQGPQQGLSLVNNLQLTQDFVQTNLNASDQSQGSINVQNCVLHNPMQIGPLNFSPQMLQNALQVLNAYKEVVSSQYQDLTNQIQTLSTQLKIAYDQSKEAPYYLHAIMIHQGFADSGHYYSYIYDRKNHSWWKFNDHSVSQESEQVVLEEAYGGQNQSKTAYSLIYINEKIAAQLEKVSIIDLYKGIEQKIDPQLKKYIFEINNQFNQEVTSYKVEKIVKNIVEQHKYRLDSINNMQSQQNSLMQKNLINFAVYLKEEQLTSFSRWFLLNLCVLENHPAQLNLINLSEDDVIYIGLTKNFSKTFLRLSDKESKILQTKMNMFRRYKQQCAVIQEIIVSLNPLKYLKAIELILYFRQELFDQSNGSNKVQNLPFDANRAFVLYCLFQANGALVVQDMDKMMVFANIAAVDGALVLESQDIHLKQIVVSLERTAKLAKKSQAYNKGIEKIMSDILTKVKKGTLTKEERLGPKLSEEVKLELEAIMREDQYEWKEGWDPNSLAFRYFNIIQEYKIKFQSYINLHIQLNDRKSTLSEDEMYKFELSQGIDIKLIK